MAEIINLMITFGNCLISELCNSALVATIVGVLLGSWIIQSIHIQYESERATLLWLIAQVDKYVETAFKYWMAVKNNENDCEVAKAKLRSEFNFLVKSTDNIDCINSDKQRVRDFICATMELFNAATGGEFDSKGISTEVAEKHIRLCAFASAKLRCLLYLYMTDKPSCWKRLKKRFLGNCIGT